MASLFLMRNIQNVNTNCLPFDISVANMSSFVERWLYYCTKICPSLLYLERSCGYIQRDGATKSGRERQEERERMWEKQIETNRDIGRGENMSHIWSKSFHQYFNQLSMLWNISHTIRSERLYSRVALFFACSSNACNLSVSIAIWSFDMMNQLAE